MGHRAAGAGRRASLTRPCRAGACPRRGRTLCAQKGWADTQVRPYRQERAGLFVGAAPCGRPRADGDIGPYGWCGPCRARRVVASFAFPPQGGRWPEGPDEGAEGRIGQHPRGYPHQSACRLTASPWKGEAFLRGAREGGLARRAKTAPAGAFRGQPPQSGGSWAEMKPAWAATRRVLCLPPGGKVARPKAVTDEGATYGAVPVNEISPALRAHPFHKRAGRTMCAPAENAMPDPAPLSSKIRRAARSERPS